MKRYLLIGCLLITGCHKKPGELFNLGNRGSEDASLIIGAGQSNMERMDISSLPSQVHNPAASTLNVAVGNTSLTQWSKGGEFYQPMIDRIKNRKTEVLFLVFYQGEWEGMNGSGADTWAERFTKWVADIRKDLGRSDLPVYFFRINEHKYAPYPDTWFEVRNQQDSVYIQGVRMIVSDGCELSQDELHYTPQGYQCLKDRLALEINGN